MVFFYSIHVNITISVYDPTKSCYRSIMYDIYIYIHKFYIYILYIYIYIYICHIKHLGHTHTYHISIFGGFRIDFKRNLFLDNGLSWASAWNSVSSQGAQPPLNSCMHLLIGLYLHSKQ